MSSLVILDTSVFIDQVRSGRHEERIQNVSGLIRSSAVVISELGRGASSLAEQNFLRTLQKNHPVLLPTIKNWIESAQILSKIRVKKGFSPDKLRDLHFDVLIALTARSYGARLITSNRADFELIATHVPFQLEIWT